jgi:hypothetical protein
MGEVEGPADSEAVYCRVASFIDDGVAAFAHRWAEQVIDAASLPMAAFRFEHCSYPHVVAIGANVPEEVDHCLESVLSLGETTSISELVIQELRGSLRLSVLGPSIEKPR